jgi:hypothetical protein
MSAAGCKICVQPTNNVGNMEHILSVTLLIDCPSKNLGVYYKKALVAGQISTIDCD